MNYIFFYFIIFLDEIHLTHIFVFDELQMMYNLKNKVRYFSHVLDSISDLTWFPSRIINFLNFITHMRNAGLEKAQAGIKIAGRNISNLRYADDTALMVETEEELKNLLMKVKEESEKVGFELNIQKTKIMASGPITSCQKDGETVETVSDFIFWGSKITADGDCNHEIKRRLLLGRNVMTNLDSILKSRDITLSTKVRLVKAMVFPLVIMDVKVGLEGS